MRKPYSRNFKVDILEAIRGYMLRQFDGHKQETVNRIALEHRELTQSVAGFRYRGKGYCHQKLNLPFYKLKPLHQSLESQITAHFREWRRHENRQIIAESAIITALNIQTCISDLYTLLPECIHGHLPDKDDSLSSLAPEKITQFERNNAEGLKTIKLQLMLNTIKG